MSGLRRCLALLFAVSLFGAAAACSSASGLDAAHDASRDGQPGTDGLAGPTDAPADRGATADGTLAEGSMSDSGSERAEDGGDATLRADGGGDSSRDAPGEEAASDASSSPDSETEGGRGHGGDCSVFAPPVRYSAGVEPRVPLVADFDGDGENDIATIDVSNFSGHNTGAGISMLLGRGDGTFRVGAIYAYPAGHFFAAAVESDFNSDGKMDVAIVDSSAGQVLVRLGNGDGTFQPDISLPYDLFAYSLAAGDLNGDGAMDLILPSVGVVLGNGDGTFQAAIPDSCASCQNAVVADFNADGKLDVAEGGGLGVANLYISLGNGDGTLQPARVYKVGKGLHGTMAVADLNGDGIPDLVTTLFYGIAVLHGLGDGTFATPQKISLDVGPDGIAVGDVDRNGEPDIVAVSGRIALLLAHHGTFTRVRAPDAGGGSLTLQDLNGDGLLDLVCTDSTAVQVLLNTGCRP